MAAQLRRVNRTLGQMQKNLECSICLDLLQDPVSTKCDHQFCSFCIHALLNKSRKSTARCPLCKEPISKRSLTSNERLNEIVNSVRCVVKAVEEDTGFKCTPPRGPRALSQETPMSVATSKHNGTIKTSPKISKTKSVNRKTNLRIARSKSSSTGIPVYIDGEESDGSESSTQGAVLITDFYSKLEGKVREDSNRKPQCRNPLQQANHGKQIRQTRSRGIPSLPENIENTQSLPENDTTARLQDVTHLNIPDAKLEPHRGSNKLLQALEEGSLGVSGGGATVEEGKQEIPKIRRNLRKTSHRQEDCIVHGIRRESVDQCTVKERERQADELDENSSMSDLNIGKSLTRSGEDVESTSGIVTSLKSGGDRDVQTQNSVAELDLELMNCHDEVLSESEHSESIEGKAKELPSTEDDPYEFIASQRTPRKPQPKRRRKNRSGKCSKEFDYMKWRKSGSVQKNLPSGSQAVFSQSSTQSQVLADDVNLMQDSTSSGDDQCFNKPTEKLPADVEKKSQAHPPEESYSEVLEQTGFHSSNNDNKLTSHQIATGTGQTFKAALTQQQSSENKEEPLEIATNSTNKMGSTDVQIVTKLPDMASAKAKLQRCSRAQKKMSKESSEFKEEHVSRRLRSRSQAPSRCERNEDVHQMSHEDDFGMESKLPKTPCQKSNDDDRCEKQSSRIENDMTEQDREDKIAGTSGDEDEEDYSFEDAIFCDDSSKRSTPDSLTDPSYEPSVGSPKLIPHLFQEVDTDRKQSRRTELHLTKAPQHSRHPALESEPVEEEEPDTAESSQPVVKKRSPLASTGVFGQVYKRRSFQQKKTLVEDDPSDTMDIDEKVQRMYSMEEGSEKDDADRQDENKDLQNSGGSERSSSPLESISQKADSQKDLFDRDRVEDIDIFDLTTESDSEGVSVEFEHTQEMSTVQNSTPHKGHEKESGQPEVMPHIEKHQQNEASTKSDWELALALAREFDTAPRQFSLRSSRRGKLDPHPDDFVHPSRTKPLLDVSLESERTPSKVSDTTKIKRGNEAQISSQEQRNQSDLTTIKDLVITAGRKTLCHKHESVSKDVEKDVGKKTRRRSSRRSSNLPLGHEIDGTIESYDSNTDQMKPTSNKSTLERSKRPNASEILQPPVYSDLGPSTVSRKMQGRYPDRTQSCFKEGVQEPRHTRLSQSRQPPDLPNSNTETETSTRKEKYGSKKITRHQTEYAVTTELDKKEIDNHPSEAVPSTGRTTRSKQSVSPKKDSDMCNKKTRSANSLPFTSSASPDENQIEVSLHKSSKLSPENFQEAENQCEDSTPECQNYEQTKRPSPRTKDGCRASDDSDTGDTTESIDLGVVEYEEEKNKVPNNTIATSSHLSGSKPASIADCGSADSIKFNPLSATPEPKHQEKSGPKETQTFGRTSKFKNARQNPGKSTQVESATSCSPKNPDSIDKGNDFNKALQRHKKETAAKEDSTDVDKPLASNNDSCKPLSNQNMQQERSSKSPKDTVPETILSPEVTQKSSSGTVLGSIVNGTADIPNVEVSRKARIRKLRSAKSADKTLSSPVTSSTVSIETSSNQESEKLLVQPPKHYQKTFVGEANTYSSSASHESTQEKCLSSKLRKRKATPKRKSCPQDSSSAEVKPSKRHRSADADLFQIQQWGMGSRQRSTRLSRIRPSASKDDSSDQQKDSRSVVSSADHAKHASSSSFCVVDSRDSFGSFVPSQRRSGSRVECPNSETQKSLPGSEDDAVKQVSSVPRQQSLSSHNDKHSNLTSRQEDAAEKLNDSYEKGSFRLGLGSCSLFEEESTKHQLKTLSTSQDVQHLLPKTASQNSKVSSAKSSPINVSNSTKSKRSKMENLLSNQENPKDVKCTPKDDSAKNLPRESHLDLFQERQALKSDSTLSLFSDNTSEHSGQESNAQSSKVATLSKSGKTPTTSLSIPYQEMPGHVEKSTKTSTDKLNTITSTDEIVLASEGASLVQDSGPIPIPRMHRKNGKSSVNSSSKEHSEVSSLSEQGSLQNKRFSFRRKKPQEQSSDFNLSSSSKEVNTNMVVDNSKELQSSPFKTPSVHGLEPPKSEMQHLNSCVSNGPENAVSSKSPSPKSASSKPQKKQRSPSASQKQRGPRRSRTSPDDVDHQEMELRKQNPIMSSASCNRDLQLCEESQESHDMEKNSELRINRQHSQGSEHFMSNNEEKKMTLSHDVDKDAINDKSHGEADSDADSSGDVEMLSAEEPCQDVLKDGKDLKGLDVQDSFDKNVEDFDEISNDTDYDDDDDIIIPPTPPCQSTTNFQIQKAAYVIRSTSTTFANSTIQASKNPASKHPKQNLEASHSSKKTEVTHSDRYPGRGQKAQQKFPIKSAPLENCGHKKSETKDAARNILKYENLENDDDDDDEMLENSLAGRVFPLSSSPLRDGDGDGEEHVTRKVTCKDDASENIQSLSVFQMVNVKSLEKRGTINGDKSLKKSSQSTESAKDEKVLGVESKPSIGDGNKHQNRDGTREKHAGNNLVELEGNAKAKKKMTTEKSKDKSSVSSAEDVEDGNIPIASEKHYDTEGSTCSERSCSHHLNLTSASSVLSSQGEIMNTQQRNKAKETLEKMAQEIAQMEAVLADDTDTVTTHQDPDTTHDRHPENCIKTSHRKNNESLPKETNQNSRSDLENNCDEACDDCNSQDDPCPRSVDLCTPGDLFTPSEVCSNLANDDDLGNVLCDEDTDSHHSTPESSDGLESQSSLRPSVLGLKRSRAVMLDDESDSDREAGFGVTKTMKSRHDVQSPDKNLVDSAVLRSQLEIPGVTTFGSDSEMSEEDLPISSGSPQSPSPLPVLRSPSPLPVPRSPSPPPELSQSTAKRVSSFKNLPEDVKAISRLATKIKSQNTGSFSSLKKVPKSKIRSTTPGQESRSDSSSSDVEVVCRTPRNKRHRPSARNSRSASRNTKTKVKESSGWKSKAIEILSSIQGKTKTGSPLQNPKIGKNTTPVSRNGLPCNTASGSGQRSNHSTPRVVQPQRRGRKIELEKGVSKLDKDGKDKSDWSEDESMDERSPSPVIGRSCLTTPGTKKQKAKTLSFVTTGLVRADMRDVEQLTKRFGCKFASTFNACTTHVIVNTDENLVCERTLKYFQGIAARVWVVSFKWVSACLKTDELLPEDPFEVLGDVVNGTSHNGPRRARLWSGSYPLHKHDVCCVGAFTGLNKEQLVSLLEMMGASTVQHPSLFPYSPDRIAIIVAHAEVVDSMQQYNTLFKKFRVPVVSREWILDVIATYKIQPMTDYLLSDSENTRPIIDVDSDDN